MVVTNQSGWITFRIDSSLERVFGGDVDAVSAMIVGPVIHGDGVSYVEIRGGSLPVGQASLPVVTVEDVGTTTELGLKSRCANGRRTTHVDIFGTLHRLLDVLRCVVGVIEALGQTRVQLNVDGRSGRACGV